MTGRKIDAMHAIYGTVQDMHCADCPHFIAGRYHDKMLFKCEAYGITHSEATDWRKRYVACSLVHLPLPDERPVIDRLRGLKTRIQDQIYGQITVEEVMQCVRDNAIDP